MEENNLSQMLNQAMNDPAFNEILAKLRSMDEKGDPALEELKNNIKKGEIPSAENINSALSGTQTPAKKESRILKDTEKHKKLISALRPYLSEEKKNAVDEIMKLSDYAGLADSLLNAKNNGKQN